MSDESCLFCRIAEGEIPATVVYEDESVIAFEDLNPQAPVHVLAIPRVHVADFAGLGDLPGEQAGDIIRGVAAAATAVAQPGGYRLATNTGPDAGQSVFHLHFHLLSGRRLGWPPG
jgi:histidine triad (HIT) family protein